MKNKNVSISLIRLVSMLMIICCHILQGLNNKWAFWVNVGVQLFFFISGFLYGKKEIRDIRKFYSGRIKRILLPYIIVLIVALSLEIFVLNNHYSFMLLIGSFLGFGGFNGNISILSHTWFISYILICYLFVPIFQKIFEDKSFKINLMYFFALILFIQMLQEFSVIKINASWINNFIFGYFYNKCCINVRQRKIYKIIILVFLLLIMPFAIIYQEKLNISLPAIMNSHSEIIVQYGHVFLGVVLFIVLYNIFNMLKFKDSLILNFFDKYSYYIYLIHQIFILNSFSILFLTKYLMVNIFLIFFFSFAFAIILKFINDLFIKLFTNIIDIINIYKHQNKNI